MEITDEVNSKKTKTSGEDSRMIRAAIQKLALGRSAERVKMAPVGTGGIGTARMIHGYVAKIHEDPKDEEYEDYAGTIDVGEFSDETASSEPVIHKGVLLSGLKDNSNGFLIIPTLFSDVTIVSDAATTYMYVVNYSHAKIIQLDSHEETTIGATETEALDPEDNDSPDYDKLEKTGNASSTKYTPSSIHSIVKDKDGNQVEISTTSKDIKQKIGEAEMTQTSSEVKQKVGSTSVSVKEGKVVIGGDDANQPVILGNELCQLMIDFLTECSKITTPTLLGTMPALNIPNFTSMISRIESLKSKIAFTK